MDNTRSNESVIVNLKMLGLKLTEGHYGHGLNGNWHALSKVTIWPLTVLVPFLALPICAVIKECAQGKKGLVLKMTKLKTIDFNLTI